MLYIVFAYVDVALLLACCFAAAPDNAPTLLGRSLLSWYVYYSLVRLLSLVLADLLLREV